MKNTFLTTICIIGFFASMALADSTAITLTNVTKQYTYKYDNVVSAFPELYWNTIPTEENFHITTVYHFNALKSALSNENPGRFGDDYSLRRIEVFVTGGDWMEYPIVYFVTDAEQIIPAGKPGCETSTSNEGCRFFNDQPRAYNIPQLSTPDREDGAVAPEVSVSDEAQIVKFIKERFLDANGMIQDGFIPLTEKK